jgi:hypothetical protein
MSVLPYAMAESNKPIAYNQHIQVQANETAKITLTGNDMKNSKLNFEIVKTPAHGILLGEVPNVNYTPYKNFTTGYDYFSFKDRNSNNQSSDESIVFLTISSVGKSISIDKYLISFIPYIVPLACLSVILIVYNRRIQDNGLRNEDSWIKSCSKTEDTIMQEYLQKLRLDNLGISTSCSEIILKEYDRYNELLKEYRTLGEKRISFFTTLITAIISALGIASIIGAQSPLTNIKTNDIFLFTMSFILLALFFFGLFIYRRIINGNITYDDQKVALDKIRLLCNFQPLQYVKSRRGSLKDMFSLQRGGYTQLVKLLITLIAGLICSMVWIFFFKQINVTVVIPFIIGSLGSWFNLSVYGNISIIQDERGRIRVI